MGGLSLWHWLIVLVVVIVIFGTKRLRNVGQDLGEAVKGFKKGMQDDDGDGDDKPPAQLSDSARRDGVGGDAPGDNASHARDTERDPPAKR